jgi:hypothetical protein
MLQRGIGAEYARDAILQPPSEALRLTVIDADARLEPGVPRLALILGHSEGRRKSLQWVSSGCTQERMERSVTASFRHPDYTLVFWRIYRERFIGLLQRVRKRRVPDNPYK